METEWLGGVFAGYMEIKDEMINIYGHVEYYYTDKFDDPLDLQKRIALIRHILDIQAADRLTSNISMSCIDYKACIITSAIS